MKKLDSNVGAQHAGQINPFLVSAEQVVSTKYKPRIWGEIETSEDFLYVIEVLETATEEDIVELHVCSRGGSGDAISTLIHSMQKCAAPIHVVMTGSVCSAGTIPMFYADSWECGEFTDFLFHEAILGTPQETMSASKAYTEFSYQSVENMLRSIYAGFFSEEEFYELFNGKQFWMTPEDVSKRFEQRQAYLASLEEALEESSEEQFEEGGYPPKTSSTVNDNQGVYNVEIS